MKYAGMHFLYGLNRSTHAKLFDANMEPLKCISTYAPRIERQLRMSHVKCWSKLSSGWFSAILG